MRRTIDDTVEQGEFRAGLRDWLRSVLHPGWALAIEAGDDDAYAAARVEAEAGGWNPFAWMATIGASGYAAPLWPVEYGGLSGQPWMTSVVREELDRYRLPTVALNLLGVGLVGPTIVAHGNPDQKAAHLRRILTGEEVWCQLFSEPGAGSDLASLSTRAERDGGEWVLNGQKVWTSLAQFAHRGMLLARTDPAVPKHDGLSYFLLDMKSPGVEVRPLRQITGSAEFTEVFLTDVRVPARDLLGTAGEGWRYARTTLANERVALSGLSVDATALSGGRRRDGWTAFLESLPDRGDPVVRQAIARLYIDQQVKELSALRAAAARARGAEPGPEGSGHKILNAALNQRRTNLVLDANGMAGVAWERSDTAAEARAHAFLRARANSIEGGTSEVLRNQVAERVLGLPREPDPDRDRPWNSSPGG